jgi:endonuclease/exonuclease/phosphatase (EEP) superfamily protein YafD
VVLRWWGGNTGVGTRVAAFSIFLLLPALPVALVALVCKRWVLAAVLVVVACLNGVWLMRERGIAHAAPRGPRLTVFTANIYEENSHVGATGRDIARSHADIVLLQELRPNLLDELEASGAFAAYPYHVIDTEDGSLGSGIWSRLPLQGHAVDCADHPMTMATVTFDGRAVSVFNAHPEAPVGPGGLERWKAQLGCVARDSRSLVAQGPTIVAGDFNATMANGPLQSIMHVGLHDAQSERGAGLTGTYPVHHRLPPLLRLDHILHSRDFHAAAVHVGPARASDHRQLVAVLTFTPRERSPAGAPSRLRLRSVAELTASAVTLYSSVHDEPDGSWHHTTGRGTLLRRYTR